MPDFGPDFGRIFPGRRRRFREPIAQHRGTKQKPPACAGGPCSKQQGSAYRLTWTLVPPAPGPAPWAPSPVETTLTQSASLSLKYEVSLDMRSASRLFCCVPEAAVVNPGSWKMTQDPLSSSVRERDTVGLSVVTLISVPARTLVPVTLYSLPLRLRMTGG
jgi:hypothetical protein